MAQGFDPDYPYWEGVSMFRKFCIIAAATYMPTGDVTRDLLVLVLACMFLVVQIKFLPYRAPEDDWLRIWCDITIVRQPLPLRTPGPLSHVPGGGAGGGDVR